MQGRDSEKCGILHLSVTPPAIKLSCLILAKSEGHAGGPTDEHLYSGFILSDLPLFRLNNSFQAPVCHRTLEITTLLQRLPPTWHCDFHSCRK